MAASVDSDRLRDESSLPRGSWSSRQRILIAVLFGALVACLAPARQDLVIAHATTLQVCPSGCPYAHIQDAIGAASPGDTLDIGAGLYAETLIISKSLTLNGAGAATTTVDGQGAGTVLHIAAGVAVTATALTLQHGAALGTPGSAGSPGSAGTDGAGGGIYNEGTLILLNVTVAGNTASGGGGGAGFNSSTSAPGANGGAGGAGYGGGLYNTGTLTVVNSTVAGNTAAGGYGGTGGMGNGEFQSSLATNGGNGGGGGTAAGGGIYSTGVLALIHTTVTANTATGGGGGYGGSGGQGISFNGGNGGVGGDSRAGNGGGIYSTGRLAMAYATISGNSAASGGGGVGGNGGRSSGYFGFGNSGGAGAANAGGGLYNAGALALIYAAINGNSATGGAGGSGGMGGDATRGGSGAAGTGGAATGAGLYNTGRVQAAIVTVSRNATAGGSGGNGGSFFQPGGAGAAGSGGGLANAGTLVLSNATIGANAAAGGNGGNGGFYQGSGGAGNAGSGGGLANTGALTLTDTTIATNTATGGSGGAPGLVPGGTVGANGIGSEGGISSTITATAILSNTILAADAASSNPDCGGSIVSGDYNLIQTPTGCAIGGITTHNITGLSAQLGPLRNNGGWNDTMALQTGSPAIDAVAPNACILHTDQRGQPRPDDPADTGFCDMGAFETQPGPVATSTPTLAPANTPTPTFTATSTPTSTFTPTSTATATPTHTSGPGWTPTGSMTIPRSNHTATRLRTGLILITGGSNNTTSLSAAEVYAPATGTFTSTGTMRVARSLHTATLLTDGSVLIAGGQDVVSGLSLRSAEVYNPQTGAFTATGRMGEGRDAHAALRLAGGKVLVVGGDRCTLGPKGVSCFALSNAELYDSRTHRWAFAGAMRASRVSHTATLLRNGKVLVTGGCAQVFVGNGACFGAALSSAEVYDPATGAFTPTGSMGVPRSGHTATLLPTGAVLITGGCASYDTYDGACLSTLSSAEVYDPATGAFMSTGPMGVARSGHTATLLPNGTVLVAGGDCCGTAELYTPRTGAWTTTGGMSRGRFGFTATLLPSGQVLAAGGDCCGTAELYTPVTVAISPTSGRAAQAGFAVTGGRQ